MAGQYRECAVVHGDHGFHFQQARVLLPEVIHPAPRRDLFRPMLRFGIALVVSAFVITLLTQTEKLFLARFDSARAVAYYAVAYTLATIVAIIPRAVKGALFPAFSQLEGAAVDRLYARAVRSLSLVIAPIAVAKSGYEGSSPSSSSKAPPSSARWRSRNPTRLAISR